MSIQPLLEVQYWGQTLAAIADLERVQKEAPASEATKMNKLMTSIPQEEVAQAEALDSLKGMKSKLTGGLEHIKTQAEAESQ